MTEHNRPFDSVLGTVGHTPIVEVQAGTPEIEMYAKLESFNPGASIKDRIGVYIIKQLLERGDLEPGGTVIEPTAGNTGIGMALAATQLDVNAVFVVPESFSVEKQTLMQALGAELVRTPADKGIDGAIERAHELADQRDNAIVPQQFANPLNPEAHYQTTGPEIYEALDGRVGAVVIGAGTAGTLMGVAEYMLEQNPDTYIVGVEPEGSLYSTRLGRQVSKGEYRIEGIGTGDVSLNELFDSSKVDDIMQISDRAAHEEMQRLAREEGQLVGSSAAAASVGAQTVADQIIAGDIEVPHQTVVTIFPDSSERYLSKSPYGSYDDWEA